MSQTATLGATILTTGAAATSVLAAKADTPRRIKGWNFTIQPLQNPATGYEVQLKAGTRIISQHSYGGAAQQNFMGTAAAIDTNPNVAITIQIVNAFAGETYATSGEVEYE